jgi:hypothetical protein
VRPGPGQIGAPDARREGGPTGQPPTAPVERAVHRALQPPCVPARPLSAGTQLRGAQGRQRGPVTRAPGRRRKRRLPQQQPCSPPPGSNVHAPGYRVNRLAAGRSKHRRGADRPRPASQRVQTAQTRRSEDGHRAFGPWTTSCRPSPPRGGCPCPRHLTARRPPARQSPHGSVPVRRAASGRQPCHPVAGQRALPSWPVRSGPPTKAAPQGPHSWWGAAPLGGCGTAPPPRGLQPARSCPRPGPDERDRNRASH